MIFYNRNAVLEENIIKFFGASMTHRNHGGIFIILLGLFGVVIVFAGIAMLVGSQGKIATIAVAIVPIVIGGAIVLEVIKSQKKK